MRSHVRSVSNLSPLKMRHGHVSLLSFLGQVRVRVLNLDADARKLVLSMRQKPRGAGATGGDVAKYKQMYEEVSAWKQGIEEA